MPAAASSSTPSPPATSRGAIGVFIVGLGSLFVWPLTIPTIIYGHLALRQIRRASGRLKGRGLAITGLIIGYAALVFWAPVVGYYPRAVRESRHQRVISVTQAQLNTLRTALLAYKNHNRIYPLTLQDLITPPATSRMKRPYVTQEMLTDFWSEPFQYRASNDTLPPTCHLHSKGPDKQDGTEDDIHPDSTAAETAPSAPHPLQQHRLH